MFVKYSIHRESAKVGTVEEVTDEYGERLITSGQAKRVDGPAAESARAAAAVAAVAGDPSTDAAAAGDSARRATPGGRRAAAVDTAAASANAAE